MKKIFLFIAALCCMTGAWSADTRTMVYDIKFPNFYPEKYLITGMTMGDDVRKVLIEQLQAEMGAPYYAHETGILPALYKYDGDTKTYKKVNDGDVLTWASYYCETQVRIDGANGKLYRFPDDPDDMHLKINGKGVYNPDYGDPIYGGYINEEASVRWIRTSLFTVKDRQVISTAIFTDFQPTAYIEPGMKMGDEVRAILGAQFHPAEDAPYYAQESGSLPTLHRWNSGTSSYDQLHDGDEITIGTYRCGTQVRIDGVPGITQCFPAKAEDLRVLVNNEDCEVYGGYVDDEASVRWIYTPFFDVRNRKCGADLTWSYDGSQKRLVISGTGAMYTFTYDENINRYRTPWYDIAGIEKVKLPTELTTIGRGAFYLQEELTQITIPNGVTSIGDKAFYGSALKTITLPNSVTSIGDEAFFYCDNLTSVVLPDAITAIGASVFAQCLNLTSIELPATVKNLGDYAFSTCTKLKSITSLATTPPTCGEYVFQSVDKSIPVYVPKGSIEAYKAAEGWKDFSTFYVKGEPCGDNLVWVFDEETGTLSFVLTGSSTGTMTDYVSTYEVPWYSVRKSVKKVELPEGLTNIGASAFAFCTSLQSVSIPTSVTAIGRSAFRGSGLKSVTVHDNVKSCGPYVFSSCANLTSVTLGSGINTIVERMFADCTGMTSFSFPSTITAIGTSAFSGCTKLASATIPYTITAIGENAFYGCEALETMNIPASVTNIGTGAFTDCTGLKSITIPASITAIPEAVFSGCSALESLTLHSGITAISAQAFKDCTGLTKIVAQPTTPPTCDADAFDGVDKDIPVYVPILSLSTYEDADVWKEFNKLQAEAYVCGKNLTATFKKGTLTVSGDGTMYDFEWDAKKEISSAPWMEIRDAIYAVELPDGLTSIGAFAFAAIPHLTEITLPDNVVSIGKGAFRDCPIAVLTRGSELAAIGDSAFYGCSKLPSIDLMGVTSLGAGAFQGCAILAEVTLDEELTAIPDYAFAQCATIEELALPNTLISIGEGAFYECSSIMELAIPANVYAIGPWAFASCSAMTSVNIPDGITAIAEGLFHDCNGLPVVEIPNSVTTIGEMAFSGCSSLGSIDIPSGVTSIGATAFAGCESLTTMVLPKGMTEIADFLFYGCTGLESVTIPQGVTSIGEMAFGYCESLPEINIPEGVAMLGEKAFFGCTSLESIEIPLGVIVIGDRTFMDCTGLKNVSISNSVEMIDKMAFCNCTGLLGVSIGSGVKTIGYWAFNDCSALTSITCKAAVPPTCNIEVFSGVDKSIPLYVPMASMDAYKTADEWKEFTNIDFLHVCGDDLTWDFNESTKTLTIFGTGDMYDYDLEKGENAPWYSLRKSIVTVDLTEHLTSIGEGAFYDCTALKNITLPNALTSIGQSAFANCIVLGSVTVPGKALSIGGGVFKGCTSLMYATLPKDLTAIPDSLFTNCAALKEITIPAAVTSIGEKAFYGCISMKSPELPKQLTTIGEKAFYNCYSITGMEFPEAVTTIGAAAFSGCAGLASITAQPTTPPACGENAFKDVDKSIPLLVHRAAIKAYKQADEWKEFTNIRAIEGQLAILGKEITPDMYGKKLVMEGVSGDVYVTQAGVFLYNATINASDATVPAIALYGDAGVDEFFVSGVHSQITAGADCPAVILATGKSTVNINNGWTNLVEHKDALTLDIYSESKKGAIVIDKEADVTLNLNGQASYSYDTLTIVSSYAGINTLYGGACDIHASGNVRIFCNDEASPIGYNDRKLTLNNTVMVLPYGGTVTDEAVLDAFGEEMFALQLRTSLPVHQSGKAYPVELGGVTVSEGNKADILGDGKASYNPDKNTLTLDGIDLDAEYAQALRAVKSSLNVEVKGTNILRSGSSFPAVAAEAGNLVFVGEPKAKLTIESNNGVQGDLTSKYGVVVQRCQVDITAIGAHNLFALQADSLTVDNGTLHLTTLSDEEDAVAWLSWNDSKSGGLVLKHAKLTKGGVNTGKELLIDPVPAYTVTFLDKSGNVIETQQVFEGEGATAPEAPAVTGYHFTGWDKTFDKITSDLTVTAQYAINVYTIKFVNDNGTVLQSTQIEYGATPAYTGATPTKQATAQYTYTFAGWTPKIVAATEDATYTATYNSTVNTYTVAFVDWDKQTLKTEKVEYGKSATAPSDPTREGYHFTGWDKDFSNIVSNLTVTAQYAINVYTVTFVDSSDKTIKTEKVEHGKAATAPEAPSVEGYHFTGWDKAFDKITSDLTVKAQYAINTYTVTFYDKDGNVLSTQTVNWNEAATAPSDPVWEGHTFTGWNAEFDHVKSDLNIKPIYDVQTYTVTFVGFGGAELKKEKVEYGKSATAPDAPAVTGYTFKGWDKDFSNITADLTVTAQYAINVYTVTFVDWDKQTLKTEKVEYGKAATAPSDPKREGYTFAGWDKDFSNIISDLTVTAQYTINKYTIKFVHEDGTLLQSTQVEYGETPVFDGATPTKQATAQYTSTFAGWTPKIVAATEDATYTATFSSTVNKYTIKFVDEDGTELQSTQVEYGATPAYTGATPIKQATAQYTYTFAGWTPTIVAVTEDATYKATYDAVVNKYTITFVNYDDAVLAAYEVEYGTTPAYNGPTPQRPKDGEYSYVFVGWTPAIMNVTGAATYKAIFTAVTNVYIITFVDEDGSLLDQVVVEYGQIPVTTVTPTKPSTVQYTYTFAGWMPQLVAATEDATYTATYEATLNKYTITAVAVNGSVEGVGEYEYGAEVSLKAVPNDGYRFDRWGDGTTTNPRTVTVVANTEYTAFFVPEEQPDYTPKNLKAVVEPLGDNDTKITLSWDKVDGVANYGLLLMLGDQELYAGSTFGQNTITLKLSDIQKVTPIAPGTYTLDWAVISLDALAQPLSDWAVGEAFTVTVQGDGEGLNDLNAQESPAVRKVLINNILYIIREDKTYNVQGAIVK